jgi:SAM-dependent methyltransferase
LENQVALTEHPALGESAVAADGYVRFKARMGDEPGLRILELGTKRIDGKPSTIRRELAHPSSIYIGTDFAEGEDVDVVSDAHSLSTTFEPWTFDLVLALSVYEHLARPWLVTVEIAKILKQGGWLFVQTHQSFPL